MIIRFSLRNYKSINEEVSLSLVSEPLRQWVDENTIDTKFKGLRLLKAVVMHGANSSGKTNVLNGLYFMRQFVLESSSNRGNIDVHPFKLLLANQNKPSKFEIELVLNEQRFVYGFMVDNVKVHSEWLVEVLKTKERNLFRRDFQEILIEDSFREGYEISDLVKSDALFLSTLGQFRSRISSAIIDWFQKISIITDYNIASNTTYTANLLRRNKYKSLLVKIFKEAKLELDDIEVEEINIDESLVKFLGPELQELVRRQNNKQLKIWTKHMVMDDHGQEKGQIKFELREESAGTQKFFAIAGPILSSLINGSPLFIDEMDSKLHVKLVRFVFDLFCDPYNNIGGGQLICINHTTNLLASKKLRRDQIILISKDSKGTKIKSAYDFKTRYDASFEKDYLKGEYGAIPEFEINQLRLKLFDNDETD